MSADGNCNPSWPEGLHFWPPPWTPGTGRTALRHPIWLHSGLRARCVSPSGLQFSSCLQLGTDTAVYPHSHACSAPASGGGGCAPAAGAVPGGPCGRVAAKKILLTYFQKTGRGRRPTMRTRKSLDNSCRSKGLKMFLESFLHASPVTSQSWRKAGVAGAGRRRSSRRARCFRDGSCRTKRPAKFSRALPVCQPGGKPKAGTGLEAA